MKKMSAVLLIIAISAFFSACDDGKTGSAVTTELNVSNLPTVVNRAILIDALWGEGEEIPQNEACVAGSQITFTALGTPFTLAKNTMENDLFAAPYIVISSLNIQIPESGDQRGASCAEGELNYLLSASADTPVDIEVTAENCPALEENTDKMYPPAGSITAHFEAEEIVRTIGECEGESEDAVCIKDSKKMFKLVVDSCE